MHVEILHCRGSHREMGVTQGRWARRRLDEVYRTLLATEFVPSLIRRVGSVNLLKKLFSLAGYRLYPGSLLRIKKDLPDQFERLVGLADGAKTGLSGLLALNEIEVLSARIQFVCGCSSIGFGRKRLKEKEGPVLAYNHDFPPFFEKFLMVRGSRPKEGYASIEMTYPTLSGAIGGVNEKGLAVSLNHAFSVERVMSGIPPTMMVQTILNRCRDTEKAIDLLVASKPACGSMISLVDKNDNMAAVELSPRRIAVRRPRDGILLTVNEYQTTRLQAIEVPQEACFDPRKFPPPYHGIAIHASNWSRRERFSRLLKKRKFFAIEEIKKIMRDHSGGRPSHLTICRHHETAKTLSSALMRPSQSSIQVIRGNPCKGKYQTFSVTRQNSKPRPIQKWDRD